KEAKPVPSETDDMNPPVQLHVMLQFGSISSTSSLPQKRQKELAGRYGAELGKYTDRGHFQNTEFCRETGIVQGMLE
ncbi:PREDICTED: putative hydrolase RBBP9, partial [Leptosomus discolor]|uniref:putative hydrolase RBBP9 n=1 Tax=Leptosomus discolor TaxID=188344 RepID=UPI0005226A79